MVKVVEKTLPINFSVIVFVSVITVVAVLLIVSRLDGKIVMFSPVVKAIVTTGAAVVIVVVCVGRLYADTAPRNV